MKAGSLLIAAAATIAASLCLFPAESGAGEASFSLRESVPLALRYDIGEILYYRLVRRTTLFRVDGSRFGEQKALGYFTRTRLENDSRGRVRERFLWRGFAFGQSMNPNEPAQLSCLKEAEYFSFVCSVQDEDLLEMLDFSSLPRSIEGFWFTIMAWDAVTFDGPVRAQEHYPFPDEALLGTETVGTREAYDFEFEYPPLVTDSKYVFSGKHRSKLIGLCALGDLPCAVVEFSYSENSIVMNFDMASVQLNVKGFEHIWGKSYLSLKDGRIVRGELVAPVLQVQNMRFPGESQVRKMELLSLQRLELDVLSPEAFESEVAEFCPGDGK